MTKFWFYSTELTDLEFETEVKIREFLVEIYCDLCPAVPLQPIGQSVQILDRNRWSHRYYCHIIRVLLN